MQQRYFFIDQLRAFAIFIIIFGHNDYTSYLGEFVTSFDLPIFFIISGFVSREKEDMLFSKFVARYSKRLLLPYLLMSVFLYLFWLLLGRHFGESSLANYSPWRNFIGIFYAQGGPEYMNWGIPMWFLPALFVVSLLDYLVARIPFGYRFIPAIAFPIGGFLLCNTLTYRLPWSIDVALVAYGFCFIGTLFRRINLAEQAAKWWKHLTICVVCFGLHILAARYNGTVLFYYGEFGRLSFLYLNGVLGFLWAFSLFNLLPTFRPLVWVGQNTLPLLAFHLLAMTAIKGVAYFVFGAQLPFSVGYSILYSLLQIVLLVPVILFINKRLPIVVGK